MARFIRIVAVWCFVTVFLLPVLFQFRLLDSFVVAPVQRLLHQAGFYSQLAMILLIGFGGLIVLSGVQRWFWFLFYIIAVTISIRSKMLLESWADVFNPYSLAMLSAFNYQLAITILLLPTVWVAKRGFPVKLWAQYSLAMVALLQIMVVMGQFLAIHVFGRPALLMDDIGMLARDSTGVYENAIRFMGTLRNPNELGMVLLLTWPALLALTLNSKYRFTMICSLLLCFLTVISVMLTYSRAAFIGLFFQAVSIAVIYRKQIIKASGVLASLAAGCLAGFLLIPSVSNRVEAIADTADASIGNRLHVFQAALEYLIQRPFSGYGPGIFATYFNRFNKLETTYYHFMNVHSVWLNTFFEFGFFGAFIGICAFAGTGFYRTFIGLPGYCIIALTGIAIPFFADNTSLLTSVAFPVLWYLCIVLITAQELRINETCGLSKKLAWVCFIVLYAVNVIIPVPSPQVLITRKLSQQLTQMKVSKFELVDLRSDRVWYWKAGDLHFAERSHRPKPVDPAGDFITSLIESNVSIGQSCLLAESLDHNTTITTIGHLAHPIYYWRSVAKSEDSRTVYAGTNFENANWWLILNLPKAQSSSKEVNRLIRSVHLFFREPQSI